MNENKAKTYLELYLSEQIDERTWNDLISKNKNLKKIYNNYLLQRRIRNADRKDRFI